MNAKEQTGKWDDRVDAALRSVGGATPEPGMEGRILTRLAVARMTPAGPVWWRRYSAPVVGFAAVSVVCAVMVGGRVEPARSPAAGPVAPVLAMPGQGVGAASAVHPAGPGSAPLPVGTLDHGRAMHRLSHGRARIAEHAHKARGVVPMAAAPQP